MQMKITSVVLTACALHAQAFVVPSTFGRTSSLKMSDTGVETIEFKIFPDGRVEETVRGIKGNNCHKVTDSVNEALGEVVASQPTEELYEQELVVDNTNYNTDGADSGDSSWSGSSSW
mmetsp:Transcript_16299/g.19585  ORF Transcript_16299/g.19585 Transcript_16299/m.19585 type:complete len:118 (+) Transcript_16299:91-444(+)|eukprot:CAMPEP_0195254272 /NCGR_PEP_ID=MMETSP0706-20130129/4961_1 /TAXON_ID=33640 /ORGANISM="Asterionellopsis glacialis, Strain CCMP134" /LENGTH=117 /DNA_ID=CAMNT_0040306931 /DNA_START=89 /DNA_END=442 /DNA_ORIENTATION=-